MNRQEITNKLLAGFAWEGMARLITQTASWVSTIWVVRILSPDDYGIVAISGIYIGIMAIICEMGFGYGIINKKDISAEEEDSIFWISILIGCSLYAIIFFLAFLLEDLYNIEGLAILMQVSGLILIISSIKTVTMALAMRELRYKYRAMLNMTGRLSNAILSIVLATLGFGAWSLVISVLVNHTIVTIGFMACMKRIPSLTIKIKAALPIIIYGTKLMGSNILEYITTRSSTFIISIFYGQSAVGIFSFANTLALIPLEKAGAMFNSVAFPALSRMQDDNEGFRNTFMNMHKYLLMLGFPILISLIVFTEPFVKLVLTEKWLSATPIIRLLCIVNLLQLSGMLLPKVIAALGFADRVFYFQLASCILLTAGVFTGAYFSLEAIAASWLFTYPLLYIFLWRLMPGRLNITASLLANSIRPVIVCSTLLFLYSFITSRLIDISNIYYLGGLVGGGVILYISSIYLLFNAEFTNLKKVFTSKKV